MSASRRSRRDPEVVSGLAWKLFNLLLFALTYVCMWLFVCLDQPLTINVKDTLRYFTMFEF